MRGKTIRAFCPSCGAVTSCCYETEYDSNGFSVGDVIKCLTCGTTDSCSGVLQSEREAEDQNLAVEVEYDLDEDIKLQNALDDLNLRAVLCTEEEKAIRARGKLRRGSYDRS